MEITVERIPSDKETVTSIIQLPDILIKRLGKRQESRIVLHSPVRFVAQNECTVLLALRAQDVLFGTDFMNPFRDSTWTAGIRTFYCTFSERRQ